jgi:hypothetical protein
MPARIRTSTCPVDRIRSAPKEGGGGEPASGLKLAPEASYRPPSPCWSDHETARKPDQMSSKDLREKGHTLPSSTPTVVAPTPLCRSGARTSNVGVDL